MSEKRETPEERFKRIATARTNAVIDKLRILGNLSNRKLYSYSDEDVRRIFTAINRQVREVKSKFETRQEKRFRL
jgi:hypothetical protein